VIFIVRFPVYGPLLAPLLFRTSLHVSDFFFKSVLFSGVSCDFFRVCTSLLLRCTPTRRLECHPILFFDRPCLSGFDCVVLVSVFLVFPLLCTGTSQTVLIELQYPSYFFFSKCFVFPFPICPKLCATSFAHRHAILVPLVCSYCVLFSAQYCSCSLFPQ